MREISVDLVREAVKKGYLDICVKLDGDVVRALSKAVGEEEQELSRFALDVMVKNAELAEKENCAVCQDTGMAVVFLEVGQDVHFVGGDLTDAVNEGVREAYREGYFRKSVLTPLTRINTKDNTPAVVHYEIVAGDKIKIRLMAKGFGSENMSRLFMLPPSKGVEGVKDAIVSAIADAGANPCPPVIVGAGIGGTMEKCALMSKKALFRKLGSENKDPELAKIEKEVLGRINALGIGAGGYGGKVTALAVFIESYPTHLAGLPVAVTVQCHASRHKEIEI